ncbi:hypothetical protein [Streptosporangium roseum]|uniref:hypothetical protein n=1 Tax=Streptosporangium roseum TaxID=2001 RepID=UPI00331C4695
MIEQYVPTCLNPICTDGQAPELVAILGHDNVGHRALKLLLQETEVRTVAELAKLSDFELMDLRNFGTGALQRVREHVPCPAAVRKKAMAEEGLVRLSFVDRTYWLPSPGVWEIDEQGRCTPLVRAATTGNTVWVIEQTMSGDPDSPGNERTIGVFTSSEKAIDAMPGYLAGRYGKGVRRLIRRPLSPTDLFREHREAGYPETAVWTTGDHMTYYTGYDEFAIVAYRLDPDGM